MGVGLAQGRFRIPDRRFPLREGGLILVAPAAVLVLGAAQGDEGGEGARQLQGLVGVSEPFPLGREGLVLGPPFFQLGRDPLHLLFQPGQALAPGQGLVIAGDAAVEVHFIPLPLLQVCAQLGLGLG